MSLPASNYIGDVMICLFLCDRQQQPKQTSYFLCRHPWLLLQPICVSFYASSSSWYVRRSEPPPPARVPPQVLLLVLQQARPHLTWDFVPSTLRQASGDHADTVGVGIMNNWLVPRSLVAKWIVVVVLILVPLFPSNNTIVFRSTRRSAYCED